MAPAGAGRRQGRGSWAPTVSKLNPAAFFHTPILLGLWCWPMGQCHPHSGWAPLPSHTSAELPSWACSETRVTITGAVSTALLMNNRQIRLCAAALVTIFCCPVWLAKCTPFVTSVCPTFFPTYWGHFPPKLARPHPLDGHRYMSIHLLFCSLYSHTWYCWAGWHAQVT